MAGRFSDDSPGVSAIGGYRIIDEMFEGRPRTGNGAMRGSWDGMGDDHLPDP